MKARSIIAFVVVAAVAIGLSGCFQPVGPMARISVDPPFDFPPLEATFDGSASTSPNGTIVSYDWDFGDGETGSGAEVTHTYEEKGVYSVTLMVTDSAGETGARSIAVEALNRVPSARFVISPYWIGAGQDARFDASDSTDPDGEIVQYLWSFGDGATAEGMMVEHAFPFAQSGGGWKPVITLTVVDEDGGTSSTSKPINVVGCEACQS